MWEYLGRKHWTWKIIWGPEYHKELPFSIERCWYSHWDNLEYLRARRLELLLIGRRVVGHILNAWLTILIDAYHFFFVLAYSLRADEAFCLALKILASIYSFWSLHSSGLSFSSFSSASGSPSHAVSINNWGYPCWFWYSRSFSCASFSISSPSFPSNYISWQVTIFILYLLTIYVVIWNLGSYSVPSISRWLLTIVLKS